MNLAEFTETQEILDNLNYTVKGLYADDEIFNSDEAIEELTEKTYQVMKYMETVVDSLAEDPGIISTSETLNVPIQKVIADVTDIMLVSTIARQAILLERMEES
jgi:hypothetical protein